MPCYLALPWRHVSELFLIVLPAYPSPNHRRSCATFVLNIYQDTYSDLLLYEQNARSICFHGGKAHALNVILSHDRPRTNCLRAVPRYRFHASMSYDRKPCQVILPFALLYYCVSVPPRKAVKYGPMPSRSPSSLSSFLFSSSP